MKNVIYDLDFTKVFGFSIVVLGLALFSSASVQAQEFNGRICAMSGFLTIQGPLTTEDGAHDIYGEASISACVDENGPVEGAEAEVVFAGGGVANCTLQSFSLTQLVEWNYGKLDFVTLQPAVGDRAPLGAYKGTVNFGESSGYKVFTTLFNKEPLQTLNCLLGIDPIGTFTFSGVQVFAEVESETEL